MNARIVCSCTTENVGIAFRLNVDPACPVHRNAQDVQTTAQTLQLALLALGQPGPMPERDMPEMPWTGPARPADTRYEADYTPNAGYAPYDGTCSADAVWCTQSVHAVCPFHH